MKSSRALPIDPFFPPFFAGSPSADPLETYRYLRCVRIDGRRYANVDLALLLSICRPEIFSGVDCPRGWGP